MAALIALGPVCFASNSTVTSLSLLEAFTIKTPSIAFSLLLTLASQPPHFIPDTAKVKDSAILSHLVFCFFYHTRLMAENHDINSNGLYEIYSPEIPSCICNMSKR